MEYFTRMAESQQNYTYENKGLEIKNSLSEDRLTPYLKQANNDPEYAFRLYLYNARLAKGFLFPLHILEVTIRNRISSVFITDYGLNWPHEQSFRSALTPESLKSLDKGISRAKRNNTSDIISELTFDFWSNLFRHEYDRSLWQKNMDNLLPNIHCSRSKFQNLVKNTNKLRNRIAHYEPIHKEDVSSLHTKILNIIEAASNETFKWTKHHSSVNSIMRTKPNAHKNSKPHMVDRCDLNFKFMDENEAISNQTNERFILCCNGGSGITAIIEMSHIGKYLLNQVDKGELFLELKEHTYADVIKHNDIHNNFLICSCTDSFSQTSELLKKDYQYLLIINEDSKYMGVISKSHRRY
jgi:hypothetical protein